MKLETGQLIRFHQNARWAWYDGYHHSEALRILEGTICLVLDVKSMPMDRYLVSSDEHVTHTLIQTPNGVAWIPHLEWLITGGVISLL